VICKDRLQFLCLACIIDHEIDTKNAIPISISKIARTVYVAVANLDITLKC